MKKIFMLFIFAVLILGCENVYADETVSTDRIISVYQYDIANKSKAEEVYLDDGEISGLKTLNLIAEVNSELYPDVTFTWYIDEEDEDIATVTSTGTGMCIGRIVGLEKGIARVWVDAVQYGNVIDSADYFITVLDTDLGSESYSELYRENSNVVLPNTGDVIADFEKTNAQHPRIMTNSSELELVDKYIVYAGLRDKAQEEWNEFERLVYEELNEKYDADKLSEDYWDYIREVYANIVSLAGQDVANNVVYGRQFIEGNLVNTAKKIEVEIEHTGMVWLLYNARLRNVNAYSDKYSSVEKQQEMLSLYQNDDYKKYPERIKSIMDMVVSFEDWHPEHFLDTAMLSYSMGMAYDWIYDYLTEEEAGYYAGRIMELGVKEGNKYLKNIYSQQKFQCNWCAVNFSGISVAAMSVFEYNPQLCARQIADTSRFLPVFLKQFSPDGAISEGTGYWILSLRYVSYLLSSMEYSFHEDYGLMEVDGFEESWFFGMDMTGKNSTDLTKVISYNYGDAMGNYLAQSALLWFAYEKGLKLGNDSYLDKTNLITWYKNTYTDRNDYKNADVQEIFWYPLLMARYKGSLKGTAEIQESDLAAWGLSYNKIYRNIETITRQMLTEHNLMSDNVTYGRGSVKVNVIMARQGLLDRRGTFFALKDTNAKSSHKDLDAGSFIFDALGVRWANDLGNTTYEGDRYSYYQKRAEGHNTLVINPSAAMDQNTQTSAKYTGNCIIDTQKDYIVGEQATIIRQDISNAYNVYTNENGKAVKNTNRVKRGYMLFDNKSRLMVQDEIDLEEPSDIYWFMQTLVKAEDYEISEDGTSVIMTKADDEGKEVKLKADLKISTDNPAADAGFTTMDYRCMSEEINGSENNVKFYITHSDCRKLAIHVSADKDGNVQKVSKAVVTVILTPIYNEADLQKGIEEILPMEMWELHSYYTGKKETLELNSSQIKISSLNPVPLSIKSEAFKDYMDCIVWKSGDERIAKVDEAGNVSAVSNGSCTISASIPSDKDFYAECRVDVNVPERIEINEESLYFKTLSAIQLSETVYPLDCGARVQWSSSDETVAMVDNNGLVTAKANGECYIIATVDENKDIVGKCKVVVNLPEDISNAKISLADKSFIYDGRVKKAQVVVKYGGITLKEDRDYEIIYKDNKNIGKAYAVVNGIGDYAGSVTKTFKIVPDKVKMVKQVNLYNTDRAKLKWSEVQGARGYVVYRSEMENGSYKKIKSTAQNYITNIALASGTQYYYKIRAYKLVEGKRVYGEFSDIICCVTKTDKTEVTVKAEKNKAIIRWSEVTGAAGYDIYMSLSKSKGFKLIRKGGKSAKSYTKNKLKKGKIYYFKVRNYRVDSNGKKIYSDFSKVKSVKIK